MLVVMGKCRQVGKCRHTGMDAGIQAMDGNLINGDGFT